ncbi:hypothetical protein JXA40_02720 [bacterium]|nr:hypothetical protein [candidate division CSSED10-310 bacterium]
MCRAILVFVGSFLFCCLAVIGPGTEAGWSDICQPMGSVFYDVFAIDWDCVYAAGSKGAVIHWDGVEWNISEYWTDAVLQHIWGASAAEIAVSGTENGTNEVHVWDGAAWSQIPENPGGGGLNGIWCSSLQNIFVAGGYSGGSPSNPYTVGYIYRWDGSAWSHYSRNETMMRGLHFFGCMIDPETGDLIGDMAVKSWGYRL